MVKYEVELTQEEKEHALVEIKKRCIHYYGYLIRQKQQWEVDF